ncbi:MAG: ABC transporter permease [Gemmatimonadales bacterium]
MNAGTAPDPRPRSCYGPALFWPLAVWSLLPLGLLAIVAFSGGWRFPSLLGAAPGTPPWAGIPGSWWRLGDALVASAGLALAVGGLSAAGGMWVGRSVAGLRGPWRALGAAALFLPVAVPPLTLGVGLQYSLLRVGLGGSMAGVLLSHLVPALGYTGLFFLGIFMAYDAEIEEEARRLGASRSAVWLRVTLPLLRRPLAEACVLGFLISWAQVPLTLIVGQGRVRTLTVEVLAWMQGGQDPLAAAGALALSLPPIALMLVVALAVRRAEAVIA